MEFDEYSAHLLRGSFLLYNVVAAEPPRALSSHSSVRFVIRDKLATRCNLTSRVLRVFVPISVLFHLGQFINMPNANTYLRCGMSASTLLSYLN